MAHHEEDDHVLLILKILGKFLQVRWKDLGPQLWESPMCNCKLGKLELSLLQARQPAHLSREDWDDHCKSPCIAGTSVLCIVLYCFVFTVLTVLQSIAKSQQFQATKTLLHSSPFSILSSSTYGKLDSSKSQA